MSARPFGERPSGLRSLLIFGALLLATLLLADLFGQHYAVRDWLFWRYLRCWLAVAVFVAAALSSGNVLVRALTEPGERRDGHLVLSFASGVYIFYVVEFAVGILGWLGTKSFFAVPSLLLAAGAPRGLTDVRAWLRVAPEQRQVRFRVWEIAAVALAATALAAIWVPTLVPENIAYDSRWYHLPLAEGYVADGAIRRTPEGAILSTYPHLTSLLDTWAFTLPWGGLFDRVVLCAQLEVAIFVASLAGIPLLVRYLVPNSQPRVAWAAIFLFPSILVYDSTLLAGADHVAALWAVPAFITFVRAYRDLRPRAMVLFVLQLCGLLMTKYTAAMAVLFPLLAVLFRAVVLAIRSLRDRSQSKAWLAGLAAAFGMGLLLTTPHWLKNWIWYGDPAYPLLRKHLHVRPWIPEGDLLFEVFRRQAFVTMGRSYDKVSAAVRAMKDYSYELYTWDTFHGRFPVVGSLGTFSLFALPLLKGTRRLWLLAIAIHAGIALWGIEFHEDRYVQVLLPWIVSLLVAIMILSFRSGWAGRVGMVALVALQLVWGADMVFWSTHQMTGRSGLELASDFFGTARNKEFSQRTRVFTDFADLGRDLPPHSKVLIHHDHPRLGIGTQTVSDAVRMQYGISYGRLGSSRALYDLLKRYGVTHVVWAPEQVFGDESLASELVFHTFVRHLVRVKQVHGRAIGQLPERAPPDEGDAAFNFACDAIYENGLFHVVDLHDSPITPLDLAKPLALPRVPLTGDAEPLLARTNRAVIDPRCAGAPKAPGFTRVANWGSKELMVRKDLIAVPSF
jgi:hypothetical protein